MLFNPWCITKNAGSTEDNKVNIKNSFLRSDSEILQDLLPKFISSCVEYLNYEAKNYLELEAKFNVDVNYITELVKSTYCKINEPENGLHSEENSTNDVNNEAPTGSDTFVAQYSDTGFIDEKLYGIYSKSFPGINLINECGELAVLYPIQRSLITDIFASLPLSDDPVTQRARKIVEKWICEVYGQENSDTRVGEGVECNYCNRLINIYSVRMRCLECADYDICERCMLTAAESQGHKISHIFFLVYLGRKRLFPGNWSASEDIVLLEALGKYGLGNWGEIKTWITQVTPPELPIKTKEECEARYYELDSLCNFDKTKPCRDFLYKYGYEALEARLNILKNNDPNTGVPDYTPIYNDLGFDVVRSSKFRPVVEEVPLPVFLDEKKNKDSLSGAFEFSKKADSAVIESVYSSSNVISFQKYVSYFTEGLTEEELEEYELPEPPRHLKYQAMYPPNVQNLKVSISGFMAYRGDLDAEWKNNAELNVCDLVFFPTDSPLERQAKFLALEAYNCILDERWCRKQLYITRKLWEQKSRSSTDSSETFSPLNLFYRATLPNYTYYESCLFLKNRDVIQVFIPYGKELLGSDLDRLASLFTSHLTIERKLKLLTDWNSAGLDTLYSVVTNGISVLQNNSSNHTISMPLMLDLDGCNDIDEWFVKILSDCNIDPVSFMNELREHIKSMPEEAGATNSISTFQPTNSKVSS